MKAKMTIKIGYSHFVMDADKALKLIDILHDAEKYEQKWVPTVGDVESHYEYFVYPNEDTQAIEVGLLPDAAYAMAKIRGKPSKD